MIYTILGLVIATIFGLVFIYVDIKSDDFDDDGDEKTY